MVTNEIAILDRPSYVKNVNNWDLNQQALYTCQNFFDWRHQVDNTSSIIGFQESVQSFQLLRGFFGAKSSIKQMQVLNKEKVIGTLARIGLFSYFQLCIKILLLEKETE